MKSSLEPGLTRNATYVTTLEMRARQLEKDVFSTPAMVGLMERTCVDLTEPHLDPDEQTVGIHVDIYHLAPTKIGQSVTISAEILEVKENKIRYSVSAENDQGVKIGAGKHRRAVIDTRRFGGA
jgi:fluoroacetyl-CoA thioesterase